MSQTQTPLLTIKTKRKSKKETIWIDLAVRLKTVVEVRLIIVAVKLELQWKD